MISPCSFVVGRVVRTLRVGSLFVLGGPIVVACVLCALQLLDQEDLAMPITMFSTVAPGTMKAVFRSDTNNTYYYLPS